MHPTSLIRAAVVLGSLTTAGLTGLATLPRWDAAPNALSETTLLYDTPQPVRGWQLRRTDGTSFSERDLVGRWTVAFVGYTRCPDVCPTTLHALSRVLELGLDVQPVFISVDPQRDVDLDQYMSSYHASMVPVTGGPAALGHAVAALGGSFAPSTSEPGLIDHSTSLFLIDPTANTVGAVLRPTRPEQVREDLALLMTSAPRPLFGELWSPPSPAGAPAVVYGSLHTGLEEPVWVTGLTSPDLVEPTIHETVHQAGIARMVERRRVLVEVGLPTVFEPGGLHIMAAARSEGGPMLVDLSLQGGHRALLRAVPRVR